MLKINLKDLYRNVNQKGGADDNDDSNNDEIKLNKDDIQILDNNESVSLNPIFIYYCIRYSNENENENSFNLENLTDIIEYNNNKYLTYSILSKNQRDELFKTLNMSVLSGLKRVNFEKKIEESNHNYILRGEYLFRISIEKKEAFEKNFLFNNFKLVYQLTREENSSIVKLTFLNKTEEKILPFNKSAKEFLKIQDKVQRQSNCESIGAMINDKTNLKRVLLTEAKLNFNKNWKIYKGQKNKNTITYGEECIKNLDELDNISIIYIQKDSI